MGNWKREKAIHDERRAQGICVKCCAPVEESWKYTYCKACRAKRNEYQRQYRGEHPKPVLTLKQQAELEAANRAMNAAARKMIEDAKINRKANKCLKCEWGSITASTVLCPFPEGSCMKK